MNTRKCRDGSAPGLLQHTTVLSDLVDSSKLRICEIKYVVCSDGKIFRRQLSIIFSEHPSDGYCVTVQVEPCSDVLLPQTLTIVLQPPSCWAPQWLSQYTECQRWWSELLPQWSWVHQSTGLGSVVHQGNPSTRILQQKTIKVNWDHSLWGHAVA